MIPGNLEEKHFLRAATQIDREGVPLSRRSYYYDLILGGKSYPPKYIISLANLYATGVEYSPNRFNAVEARNYFSVRGYQVIDRRNNAAILIVSKEDELAYPEGKKRFSLHRTFERNSELVNKAKMTRFENTGKLQCDVCSFDFKETYGSLGEGFIEAHHTVPVAMLRGRRRTKLSEIALVCSNCHRMLHREKNYFRYKNSPKSLKDNKDL